MVERYTRLPQKHLLKSIWVQVPSKLQKYTNYFEKLFFYCKFVKKFFDKSDKYHNKLITLLFRDGVTNVMAAWIDSKLLRYNSTVEMAMMEAYAVVRLHLSQQVISNNLCSVGIPIW